MFDSDGVCLSLAPTIYAFQATEFKSKRLILSFHGPLLSKGEGSKRNEVKVLSFGEDLGEAKDFFCLKL
jgi:hypothetical protein